MASTSTSCNVLLSSVLPLLEQRGLVLKHHLEAGLGAKTNRAAVRTDSRQVGAGDIFLAYKGVKSDGHEHLAAAVQSGASLLIVAKPIESLPAGTSWILVQDTRVAWSYLAAAAHGQPQEQLKLIGVTGTNGKTSTIWMVGELLRAAGEKCLTVGTLGAFFGDEMVPTGHTTPDPDVLFGLMAKAVSSGYKVAAMEVSSHSIAQGKVAPLHFAATAFTSFSRDHLDFHRDLNDYWDTKLLLFTDLAGEESEQVFAASLPRPIAFEALPGRKTVYGFQREINASDRTGAEGLVIHVGPSDFSGTTLKLYYKGQQTKGKIPYFSSHAVENFAAAMVLASKAAGRWLGADAWSKLRPVPGRLETVLEPGKPAVVVDYAHTPDALEKTLQVLRPLCRGKICLVFGCGGDRDRGKRPIMGAIAERYADQVFVTSDNPRSEDPASILQEIIAGMTRPNLVHAVIDRADAIAKAIAAAGPDDLVLIAGKGHENSQIFAKSTIVFDDRHVARRASPQAAERSGEC